MSAAHHGNTPAAWTAVLISLAGFVVGGAGLMLSPISMLLFWIGCAMVIGAGVVFVVMDKMGLHNASH